MLARARGKITFYVSYNANEGIEVFEVRRRRETNIHSLVKGDRFPQKTSSLSLVSRENEPNSKYNLQQYDITYRRKEIEMSKKSRKRKERRNIDRSSSDVLSIQKQT